MIVWIFFYLWSITISHPFSNWLTDNFLNNVILASKLGSLVSRFAIYRQTWKPWDFASRKKCSEKKLQKLEIVLPLFDVFCIIANLSWRCICKSLDEFRIKYFEIIIYFFACLTLVFLNIICPSYFRVSVLQTIFLPFCHYAFFPFLTLSFKTAKVCMTYIHIYINVCIYICMSIHSCM